MSKSNEITKPKLLIGEGIEEKIFFAQFIKKKLPNHQDISIHSYDGKDKLSDFLALLKVAIGFGDLKSLGITRDADNSIQSAFQSVCSALRKNDLPTPSKLNNPTATNDNLKVSIFILPDNKQDTGMLEDLCLRSVDDDPGISCVDDYFQCIDNQTQRQPKNMAKAKVHAWLASQEVPDKRLGEAAQSGYWNFDNPTFDNLEEFIRCL